jgi:hypothetical protein
VRRAVADDHQLRPAGADVVDPVAQLRDVLAAEQSAKVPHEGEDHGVIPPQAAQPDRPALPVAQLDPGETGGGSHGSPIACETTLARRPRRGAPLHDVGHRLRRQQPALSQRATLQ